MIKYEVRIPPNMYEEFRKVVPENGTMSGAIRALIAGYIIKKQRGEPTEELVDPRFSAKAMY